MNLHLITLVVNFKSYKWVDTVIQVVEKEKTYVVTQDNDEYVLKLVPELIPKNRVNVILANSRPISVSQISLAIYCPAKDIAEAKDKLITEISRLSEAYRQGFEAQKTILEGITHENKQ